MAYKNREFVVAVRKDAVVAYPLLGKRTLHEAVFAGETFPMTISAQDSFVIYDLTQKTYLVYNIVTCLKGKDATNSEKTDWVGIIKPSADHWEGDILVLRKYDKKGPLMRIPYYSMGRAFPTFVKEDGTCTVQYNYFGNLVLDLVAREVPEEMLKRMIDEYDMLYFEHKENE